MQSYLSQIPAKVPKLATSIQNKHVNTTTLCIFWNTIFSAKKQQHQPEQSLQQNLLFVFLSSSDYCWHRPSPSSLLPRNPKCSSSSKTTDAWQQSERKSGNNQVYVFFSVRVRKAACIDHIRFFDFHRKRKVNILVQQHPWKQSKQNLHATLQFGFHFVSDWCLRRQPPSSQRPHKKKRSFRM